MVTKQCHYCGKEVIMFPSRAKKSTTFFCNKSCHRSYKNVLDNPVGDMSGEKNPMFGRHLKAWNKDIKGEESHNWKGGIHKRIDGYVRVNIKGKRFLYHRVLTNAKDGQVVHHIDHNPSNNSIENLKVFNSQSEHVVYEKTVSVNS